MDFFPKNFFPSSSTRESKVSNEKKKVRVGRAQGRGSGVVGLRSHLEVQAKLQRQLAEPDADDPLVVGNGYQEEEVGNQTPWPLGRTETVP